jgi:hypothetical protein
LLAPLAALRFPPAHHHAERSAFENVCRVNWFTGVKITTHSQFRKAHIPTGRSEQRGTLDPHSCRLAIVDLKHEHNLGLVSPTRDLCRRAFRDPLAWIAAERWLRRYKREG